MTYLKLPRQVGYANRGYLDLDANRNYRFGLNDAFPTLMPPVNNDEPLVRSYLAHFFIAEDSFKEYEPYVDSDYLKDAFAETKIVNGLGDQERLYAMLTPERYRQLKERIDLDFAYTNKMSFGPDEPVTLDVYVKNVESLILKVYEINALNYYLATSRELDTDINLDGLVANEERVFKYDDVPLRRVLRRFGEKELTALKNRGTYVIEFIGNGKASRALVRKGSLTYLARSGAAGHVLTVLNESNQKQAEASVWLAGKQYKADKDGAITIPYTNKPGRYPIILAAGASASLDTLDHQGEEYALRAAMYVDRESLLKRKTAPLVIRPALYVNGTPIALGVLEEVRLAVSSVDGEGVATTKEVPDFKLETGKETIFQFDVPENTRQITFALRAKVQNLSQNRKVDLADQQTFALNQMDATDKIENLLLMHVGSQYVLEARGKTGEPRVARPVNLVFKHRDFSESASVHCTLQTDAQGRIALGALEDIERILATSSDSPPMGWRNLPRDRHNYPSSVSGQAGRPLEIPFMGAAEKPKPSDLSLLETRGGTFVADWFGSLKLKDGMVVIDDLPPGDYDLFLKDSGTRIAIHLAPGEVRQGYVLGEMRQLQIVNDLPLQIAAVTADADTVTIRLTNSKKSTRVHVVATRYLPEYPMYDLLAAIPHRDGDVISPARNDSAYIAGRDIGDEFRYILDRKYAAKFPGNMLGRPGLLLNPWAIRKTETGEQRAAAGGVFGAAGAGRGRGAVGGFEGLGRAPGGGNQANLDFLGQPAVVLANIEPDKGGVVKIKRAGLGAHQQIHVVAVDPLNTAYREVSLAEVSMPVNDLRLLASALDVEKHFTEQKAISIVRPGEKLVIDDLASARFETYDSLAKVYALYATLSHNADLAEFSFITTWPKLKDAEKREKYSKYACHELSFFLSRKDPEFFKAAVLPYLASKKDKTFMDHYLLGADLREYLAPWKFGQLNIVERTLLAQRIAQERAGMARHIKDLWDLVPPNVDYFNLLFKTALKGSALETGDAYGAKKAMAQSGPELTSFRRELLAMDGRPTHAAAAPDFRGAAPPVAAPSRVLSESKAAPAAGGAPAEESEEVVAEDGKAMTVLAAKPAAPRQRAALEARSKSDRLAKAGEDLGYADETDKRKEVRAFFRRLDKTEEWAENNYWHLPVERQNAALVTVNSFWRDYAAFDGQGPFFSTNLAEASHNFTEMMLTMAVLDLPFDAAKHESKIEGVRLTLVPGSPMVVYHKEIRGATRPAEAKTPILVSENFFRASDRYTMVDNERLDKYVTGEFLIGVVYGCQVVITNPTSSPQKLDALIQVPKGAVPVQNSLQTRGVHMDLTAYATQTLEYYFYFPLTGEFPHYPVHVARNETLIAFVAPTTLKAVERLSKVDKTSWDYLSQYGSPEEVLDYLKANNIDRIRLDRIAWRMHDKPYFETVLALLSSRHVYNHTLWSYGVKHNAPAAIREFLLHAESFVNQTGLAIDSPLLVIDPVIRKTYQHLEYVPLVSARAHRLGQSRKILNDRLYEQYLRLMKVLSYQPVLDQDDLMAVTYYLLLQDRTDEAAKCFGRVDAKRLATRLQYDYFAAYLDFYTDAHKLARGIAERYKAYPVDRWRNLFVNVLAQLDEIEGKGAKVVDKEDRTQQQTALAATEPSFDFSVEARKIVLKYQNLLEFRVSYYRMDVELLFSTNPFVQQHTGQFSYIKPNLAAGPVRLAEKGSVLTFDLPAQFHNDNVMIEIEAGGLKKSQAYYANSLAIQTIENFGQVKVAHEKTGAPLAKVYVKVYARTKDGQVRFYKDGYTDLRGRFDYASLNTNELENVAKFSLLVLSETDGAAVREANPPKQ